MITTLESVRPAPGAPLEVVRLAPAQFRAWDRFVSRHPRGGVHHSSRWRSALESAFPHIRGHFLAIEGDGSRGLAAGLPLYEVRSWLLGRRLVSVPYASWCDPLVESEAQLAALLGAARALADELGCTRIEMRCRERGASAFPPGWTTTTTWRHHATDLAPEPDILLSGLSRTAVRRFIRRAESQGVEVTTDDHPDALSAFHDDLAANRRNLGLPVIPRRFFTSLRESLAPHEFVLCVARRGDRRLGAVLGIRSHDVFHLEHAAGNPSARGLGVMQLLYWKALELARTLGCREFSLGRTSPDNTGLLAYKRHWNTREDDLTGIEWHRNGRAEGAGGTRLGAVARPLASWSLERLPVPVCRSLSSLIYGHWG